MLLFAPLDAAPKLVKAPVAVFAPVPPCATDSAVVSPLKDVMLLFAPLDAAPNAVKAAAADVAPVPPAPTPSVPNAGSTEGPPDRSGCPAVPTAVELIPPAPSPISTPCAVSVVWPVPPLATGIGNVIDAALFAACVALLAAEVALFDALVALVDADVALFAALVALFAAFADVQSF